MSTLTTQDLRSYKDAFRRLRFQAHKKISIATNQEDQHKQLFENYKKSVMR